MAGVAAAIAAAAADAVAVAEPTVDLVPLATAIGERWVVELVAGLRSVDREVVGAWPGTISEARMRVRAAVAARIESTMLEELARVANLAARRGWQQISGPDLEP